MMESIDISTETQAPQTIEIFKITMDEWFEFVVSINWAALLIGIIGTGLLVWSMKYFFRKRIRKKIILDGMSFGIGDFKCELKCGNETQEIAYRLWIELTTRKIAIPLDENDVIVEVYNSWYSAFQSIREQLKTVPGSYLADSSELIDITTKVLNEGLRPHLTKWQAKFRTWYQKECENSNDPPQIIQKRYPEYDALMKDLRKTTDNMINFSNKMKEIAFGK